MFVNIKETIFSNTIPSIKSRQEKEQTFPKKDSPTVGLSAEKITNTTIESAKPKQYKWYNNRLSSLLLIRSLPKRFDRLHSLLRIDGFKTLKKVLNVLLTHSLKHKEVYKSQDTVAHLADVSREHTNRILHDLQALGFLRIHNRGYNTCVYFINKSIFAEHRESFSKYFPVLKSLGLWLLMNFNMSSGSSDLTPLYTKSIYLKNIKRYEFSKDSIGVGHTNIEGLSSRSRRIMEVISQKNREISNKLGFTDYARVINTAFDDNILQIAYNVAKKKRIEIDHIFTYFHAICKKASKMQGKQINWVEMYERVRAAGFKPGARLLHSDTESQPTYKSTPEKILKQEIRKPINNENNSFLKQFGIPEWLKDNDKARR